MLMGILGFSPPTGCSSRLATRYSSQPVLFGCLAGWSHFAENVPTPARGVQVAAQGTHAKVMDWPTAAKAEPSPGLTVHATSSPAGGLC
jgi:hypothetical protein